MQRRTSVCVSATGTRVFIAAYATEPALLAMRGQRSAHSLPTGPVMAEPATECEKSGNV